MGCQIFKRGSQRLYVDSKHINVEYKDINDSEKKLL